MAELSTIARPYAQAAFNLADESGALAAWSEALGSLALIAQDPAIASLTGNPNVGSEALADVFLGVLEGKLSEPIRNFVRLVAESRRVSAFPEISAQFDRLKTDREGVQDVEIVSAFPLETAQQADLAARLEQHTGKKVNVHVTLDPQLISGVKIVMGDKVIDASARAQLAALEGALRA